MDNLKLGYGGTKTEMERLIKDAAAMTDVQKELGITVDASSMSFDNIVNAIHVMQTSMGIAGTTSAEAAGTIEGSVGSMKAAWDNLLVSLASGNKNYQDQLNALVSGVETAFKNVWPIALNFLTGFADLMGKVGPIIVEKLPEMITTVLPALLNAAVSIVGSLVNALPGILQAVVAVFGQLVQTISDELNARWPIVGKAFDAIVGFAQSAFNGVISFLRRVFSGDFVGAWEDLKSAVQSIKWSDIGTHVKTAVGAAWSTLKSWATPLWNNAKAGIQAVNWAEAGQKAKDLVKGAWKTLKSWATSIWNAAKEGIQAVQWEQAGLWIVTKIGNAVKTIVDWMKGKFDEAVAKIKEIKWDQLGTDIWTWISDAFKSIASDFTGFFSDAKSGVEGDIDWKGLGSSILDFILVAFMKLSEFLLNFFKAAWKDIKGIEWEDLGQKIRDFIIDGLAELGDKIRGLGEDGYNGIAGLEWVKLGADILAHIMYGLVMLPVGMVNLVRDGMYAIQGQKELANDSGRQMLDAFMGTGAFGSLPPEAQRMNMEALANVSDSSYLWGLLGKKTEETFTDGMSDLPADIEKLGHEGAGRFDTIGWGTLGHRAGSSVASGFAESVKRVSETINSLQMQINNLKGKTVTITVNTKGTASAIDAVGSLTRAHRNASAMDTGHIFQHPTIFGYADGKYQIAGDVGAEAVVGVSSLNDMIQTSVNRAVGQTQTAILGVLSEILKAMPSGQLVLDTGALVGGIGEEMNAELERIAAWNGGGRA